MYWVCKILILSVVVFLSFRVNEVIIHWDCMRLCCCSFCPFILVSVFSINRWSEMDLARLFYMAILFVLAWSVQSFEPSFPLFVLTGYR